MHTVRTLAAVVALTAAGLAQAAEYTNFPLETSMRSRAEVQAEARAAVAMPGELYDGGAFAMPSQAAKSRDAVRVEARAALRMIDPVMFNDQIGG